MSSINITDLPIYVLEHIFSYFSISDLRNVAYVNKLFHMLSKSDYVWKFVIHNLEMQAGLHCIEQPVCHQCPNTNSQHSWIRIPERKRYYLTRKWRNLSKQACTFIHSPESRTHAASQIRLYHNTFFYSLDHCIYTFAPSTKPNKSQICYKANWEVETFAVWDSYVAYMDLNRSLVIFDMDDPRKIVAQSTMVNRDHGQVLDFRRDMMVSGCRDGAFRAWRFNVDSERAHLTPLFSVTLADRVWSLAVLPHSSMCLVGTGAVNDRNPLLQFDLTRSECVARLHCLQDSKSSTQRKGAGIRCMDVLTPQLVLTGGYDAALRLWDLRAAEPCVQTWLNPVDAVVSSVQGECGNSQRVVLGTMHCGMVLQYDLRSARGLNFWFPPTALPSQRTHSRKRFRLWKPEVVDALAFTADHLLVSVCDALIDIDLSAGYS